MWVPALDCIAPSKPLVQLVLLKFNQIILSYQGRLGEFELRTRWVNPYWYSDPDLEKGQQGWFQTNDIANLPCPWDRTQLLISSFMNSLWSIKVGLVNLMYDISWAISYRSVDLHLGKKSTRLVSDKWYNELTLLLRLDPSIDRAVPKVFVVY